MISFLRNIDFNRNKYISLAIIDVNSKIKNAISEFSGSCSAQLDCCRSASPAVPLDGLFANN
jgi:hypothetical protein